MRGFRGVLLALAAMLVAGPAAAEYKIGYVDVRKVVEKSEQAEQAKGRLQEQVEQRQSELESQRSRIGQLRDELNKQGSLMSQEQRKEKERQLQEELRAFRRAQQQAQEDIDAKKSQVLQDIYDRVFKIVKRIGEKESYDLILTAPSAMYVAEKVDLTQRVLEKLNSKSSP